MQVAGVMSGSSLDGLDVVLVDFGADGYEVLLSETVPFSDEMRQRLRSFHTLDSLGFLSLDRAYAVESAQIIQGILGRRQVNLLGFHGHTTVHIPDDGITHQLGNGGILSALLGMDVVTDFRIQDVSKGGEGTPLVSIMDMQLFSGYDYYLNLGGIANITNVANGAAYDICPCNQVLNYFCQLFSDQEYDKSGSISRKGNVQPVVTARLDELGYWATAPPKSLDNTWIKEIFMSKILFDGVVLADILASYIDWAATKIADTIEIGEGQKLLATGGGTHNTYFVEVLNRKLATKGCELVVPTDEIINFKEAILMAYLAYLRHSNQPNVLSRITNATTDTIAGAYYKA